MVGMTRAALVEPRNCRSLTLYAPECPCLLESQPTWHVLSSLLEQGQLHQG